MSEKLYRLLLRLYPARFRKEYGEEAVQLFGDRLRHEAGFLQRLRLWMDVLMDLSLSLPREYRRAPSTIASAAPASPAGVPLFQVLEEQPPRPGTFVTGAILAFAALGVFGVLLKHGGKSFPASFHTSLSSDMENSALSHAEAQTPNRPESLDESFFLSQAERQRVIHAVIMDLSQYYKHPGKAQTASTEIATHEKKGDYDAIVHGDVFAATLTRQMRDAVNDPELRLVFFKEPIGLQAEEGAPELHPIDEHFALRIPR
jgi:hypothetical protein